MTVWVWADGTVVPAGQARLDALDRGVTLGEGLFETLKVVEGVPFALTRHLARLRAGAAAIELHVPWSDEELRTACAMAVGAALTHPLAGSGTAFGRLRITVTGGPAPLGPTRVHSATPGPTAGDPSLFVAAAPASPPRGAARVAVLPWVRNERSPTVGVKSVSHLDPVRELAEARRRGADEAIVTNTVGALCEGAGSNLFLVVDDVLCTPSLSTGCLAGITRELVLELMDVVEHDDLTVGDLMGASEAFITSSLRDVQPIAAVDEVELVAAGPVTTEVMSRWAAMEARTFDP